MLLLFPLLLLAYVVAGLGISLIGARWVGRRFNSRWASWGAFALFFTLFFGDEILGGFYWRYLCNTQGGLHLYRLVPVDGFLYGRARGFGASGEQLIDKDIEDYLKRGYKYVEGEYSGDKGLNREQLYRFTLGDDGNIHRSPIDQPQSQYVYSYDTHVPYPHYVWGSEVHIKNWLTNELIGAQRHIGYKGSTIVQLLRRMTGASNEGSADYCGDVSADLLNVVIPPLALVAK